MEERVQTKETITGELEQKDPRRRPERKRMGTWERTRRERVNEKKKKKKLFNRCGGGGCCERNGPSRRLRGSSIKLLGKEIVGEGAHAKMLFI